MCPKSRYLIAQSKGFRSTLQLDALLAAKGKKIESVIDLQVDDEVRAENDCQEHFAT